MISQAENHFVFGTCINWGHVEDHPVRGPGMKNLMGMTTDEWIEWALNELNSKHINTLFIFNFPNPLTKDSKGDTIVNSSSEFSTFTNLANDRGIRLIPKFQEELLCKPVNLMKYNQLITKYDALISSSYVSNDSILAWCVAEEINKNDITNSPGILDYIQKLVEYIDSNNAHPGFVVWGPPDGNQYKYQPSETNPFPSSESTTEEGIKIVQPNRSRSYYSIGDTPGIICFDCYPFFTKGNKSTTGGSLYYLENNIKQIYDWSVPYQSPIWVIGQAYSLSYLRYPTINELYWQAWLAILYGAKGILYFTFTSCNGVEDQTGIKFETYTGFVSPQGLLKNNWHALADIWHNISPFKRIIMDIHPTTVSGPKSGPFIKSRWFQRNATSEKYLIVVNTDVVHSLPTGVQISIATGEWIYDLRAGVHITPHHLEHMYLKPGRGNIYMIGTDTEFEYYLLNYAHKREKTKYQF